MPDVLFRVPDSAGELYERIDYPAGELQVRLLPAAIKQLFESEGVTILCRRAHQHLMELMLLGDAIAHLIPPHLASTLVLPYLPYSRADRRFQEGDCNGLKTFGDIFNWSGSFGRIRTLDVHSFRARKCIGPLDNISPEPFVAQAMTDVHKRTGSFPVVLLPDEGAKRYAIKDALQCAKKRDAKTGKLTGFKVPEFEQTSALIVDDICDGGGTFIGLAKEIRRQRLHGRKRELLTDQGLKLYLYVTHGIFSKGLRELLDWFDKVYTTDSVYPDCVGGGLYFPSARLQVFECEPVLLEGK